MFPIHKALSQLSLKGSKASATETPENSHRCKKRKVEHNHFAHTSHPDPDAQISLQAIKPFERSREDVTSAYNELFASWEEASSKQRRVFNRYLQLSETTRDKISITIMNGFDLWRQRLPH